MIVTDLKNGTIFKDGGHPFLVLKYQHIKVSRGSAQVKVRAKNIITGQVLEKTWQSGASVEDAYIENKNAQYLYKDSNGYVFMSPNTYDQFVISEEVVGDSAKFLKEGENVIVKYFEGQPYSVDLPISMVFEIKYTEPGFKGNTVTNVYKDAELDNGTKVKVPMFIKIGDRVKVDTRTGEYVSKA
ncbi:elongation factor P [candidate division WWE3 bacterium]|uniref:Elongation factor P n=1 Tax=candidate division WWE3 bacterium TaxID=2053526 RepID=A0A7X9E7T6_UNCKA|nr:elongation factor P [candidate division WWE3 bacterium]